MVLSSLIFILGFLPIVLGVYHILMAGHRFRPGTGRWLRASNGWLLAASLFFYGFVEHWIVFVMIGTLLVDYVCGLAIGGGFRRGGQPRLPALPTSERRRGWQRALLLGSLAYNLGVLAFLKYANFGLDNYNALAAALGLDGLAFHTALKVVLPVGVSFYTFQSLSYTIDVYRGHVPATRSLGDFACYVTLFPQLVAGPIVRYATVQEQLRARSVSLDDFAYGVNRFARGLAKKVLIANTVAVPAEHVFALPHSELTMAVAWVGIVCYTLQIYFDFSGYSDMAIGLGRMLGFHFLENFEHPYVARSMQEFWRRWHVSLSTWFRDYVFLPLSYAIMRRTDWLERRGVSQDRAVYAAATLATMGLCGLWHGASWPFVVWGLYHGALLAVERLWLGRRVKRLPVLVQHAYTTLLVMAGWVLFRSESFPQAVSFLGALAGARPLGARDAAGYLSADVVLALIAGAVFSVPVYTALSAIRSRLHQRVSGTAGVGLQWSLSAVKVAALVALVLASLAVLSSGSHNPFIYDRF